MNGSWQNGTEIWIKWNKIWIILLIIIAVLYSWEIGVTVFKNVFSFPYKRWMEKEDSYSSFFTDVECQVNLWNRYLNTLPFHLKNMYVFWYFSVQNSLKFPINLKRILAYELIISGTTMQVVNQISSNGTDS